MPSRRSTSGGSRFRHKPELNDQLHHVCDVARFTPSRPRGQCLSPGRMSFHFNHMPTIHKRLQHFLCSPRFRFHGGNRNGPTAAVSHHGSTRSEFALEHTSHCEKFAQSPPGTAFTIRHVTLRGWDSRLREWERRFRERFSSFFAAPVRAPLVPRGTAEAAVPAWVLSTQFRTR